ncbi:hypothetical protein E7V51_25245 [Escherichia coli]|nr:hypothetical protein [Escherichia coli]
MSIKNDGHYFCRAGGNRPDGLNEPVTKERVSRRNNGFFISPKFGKGHIGRIFPTTSHADFGGC